MLMKIAAAGATAAVILGGATVALAAPGGSSGTSSHALGSTGSAQPGSTSRPGPAKAGHRGLVELRRVVHGQVVTRGKGGAFVTHDIIRGQVTTVSPTSIGVSAADGTTEAFTVNSKTRVATRTDGKASASSIGQVKVGDRVAVRGTGTRSFTARRVVDIKR